MKNIDEYKDENGEISRENIKKIIPYEDPFLLIDSVKKLTKSEIVAEKTVREDEDYLKGHFKDFPIMPGALIVEGLGQAATLMIRYNLEGHLKYDVLAYKISGAKFFRPSFSGQTLRFEVKKTFKFKIAWFVKGEVYRGDKQVAKVKMVLAVVEKDRFRKRYQKKESVSGDENKEGSEKGEGVEGKEESNDVASNERKDSQFKK